MIIRGKRIMRFLAVFTALNIIIECVGITVAYALTSGPSQPEVQSFEPAGTTQMVDVFTGDFTYNIPLFELPGPNGGYPFNLAYHAGVGMDQEASWVGLGWSLNPGAITRQMRGLPDDFQGDVVKKTIHSKPNNTVGLGAGGGVELFGSKVGIGGSLSIGLQAFYNNYRGLGFSLQPSLELQKSIGSMANFETSINFSANSQTGGEFSFRPTLNLAQNIKKLNLNYNLGAGYSSRLGLTNLNLNVQTDKGMFLNTLLSNVSHNVVSSALPLLGGNFLPEITMPYRARSFDILFKTGPTSIFGIYPHPYLEGFFNTQYNKDNGEQVNINAYGYMYQNGNDGALPDDAIMDFNREKDGMVTATTLNLPIPHTSFDIFNATGQGVSGMFRAHHSGIGLLRDRATTSNTVSGSLGFDIATVLFFTKLGINLTIPGGISTSGGIWDNQRLTSIFNNSVTNNGSVNYEPYYFQAMGEMVPDDVQFFQQFGEANAIEFQNNGKFFGNNVPLSNNTTVANRNERKIRNNIFQPITNEYLGSNSANEFIVYDESDNEMSIDRSSSKHIGAVMNTSQDGTRYIYALPVYNVNQIECQFSVTPETGNPMQISDEIPTTGGRIFYERENTNQYFNKTELPKFVYSHLLTAVLGPDYVDVTGNGITADDLGYWVRFSYEKTVSDYKWRAPFLKANYSEGLKSTVADDQGSYMYGEKEIYYLKRVETKSHVAEFTLSTRDDGRGAKSEFQKGVDKHEASQSKLDNIKLFSREEFKKPNLEQRIPIKIIEFGYDENDDNTDDYSLCKGVDNNATTDATNNGKLTLHKLIFKYGRNNRGAETPYTFKYGIYDFSTGVTSNPIYEPEKQDRWGSFIKVFDKEFPYVNQEEGVGADERRVEESTAWNLSEITMPSGGKILVNYEPDDYGYVQDKVAMQMTKITGLGGTPISSNPEVEVPDDNRRIYFKLEYPIKEPMEGTEEEKQDKIKKEVLKYFDETDQLYFKVRSILRPGAQLKDDVSGYAKIVKDGNGEYSCGAEVKIGDEYTHGYVDLEAISSYHPFKVAGWQHLQANRPALILNNDQADIDDVDLPTQKIMQALLGLGAALRQAASITGNYYNFANNNKLANQIDLDHSYIRLNSPDRKKYGGGHRVKQITMLDDWSFGSDQQSGYGQYYEYTTTENEKEISSGVASYEPLIGGDEIALRRARFYKEGFVLKADELRYTEYPYNEHYFPAPIVGYSKVTVMSLANAKLDDKPIKNDDLLNLPNDTDYGATGKTVHEFYTAKDFPVISTFTTIEPDIDQELYNTPLGSYSEKNYTGVQGYAIELNDMHGKVKKVSNFGYEPLGAVFKEKEISHITYHYKQNDSGRSPKNFLLDNSVKVLEDDRSDGTIVKTSKNLGVSSEIFVDVRQTKNELIRGGVELNIDMITFFFPPITFPTVKPSFNAGVARDRTRTIVTNKIIHRSGILQKVEAYDRGSTIVTENLLWDNLTGEVVLTSVQNNFGDPIFSYNIPAHLKYEGMGAAYKNTGLRFNANIAAINSPNTDNLYRSVGGEAWLNYMYPGDELIVSSAGEVKGTAIFKGVENGKAIFYSESDITGNEQDFFLYRSGRRNQLSASVANITTLADPTDVSNRSNCETCGYNVEVTVPNE